MNLIDLKKRVLEISFKKKLSHIGSCLVSLPIIYNIYTNKKDNDIFILSAGHSGLSLYVILEAFEGKDAEKIFDKHGVHPNRDLENGIYCSTGSLGHGLGIAVGSALADRKKDVYCLVTDGELAEGSCWESLRIAKELELDNLKVYAGCNGYGAYGKVDYEDLQKRVKSFGFPVEFSYFNSDGLPSWLSGLKAHYQAMNKAQYQEMIKYLEDEDDFRRSMI